MKNNAGLQFTGRIAWKNSGIWQAKNHERQVVYYKLLSH